MAGEIENIALEKNKSNYLNQDRAVNIRKHMDKQEKLEKSGLQNIEIRDRAKQLGKDDFLLLLVKQLTHQDPTAPIKDQAFIAQMAQFSSLEQMQNMAASINKLSDRQAMDLVGKFIMAKDFVSGEPVTGIAQALFFDHSGQAFLKVSGKNVAIKDVQLIGDPSNFKREFGGTAAEPARRPAVPAAPLAPAVAAPNMRPAPGPEAQPANKANLPAAAEPGNNTKQAAPTAPTAHNPAAPASAPVQNLKPPQPESQGEAPAGAAKEKPVSFVEMIHGSGAGGRAFSA